MVRFCGRALCGLQLYAALDACDIRHHSHTDPTWNMTVSGVHFIAFFQGEDKRLERGENHYKSGQRESCSYASGDNGRRWNV